MLRLGNPLAQSKGSKTKRLRCCWQFLYKIVWNWNFCVDSYGSLVTVISYSRHSVEPPRVLYWNLWSGFVGDKSYCATLYWTIRWEHCLCTMYSVQCIVYMVYSIHGVQCTVYSVQQDQPHLTKYVIVINFSLKCRP